MKKWHLIAGLLIVAVAIGGWFVYANSRRTIAENQAKQDMLEFTEAYQDYLREKGAWPTSLDELKPMLDKKSSNCQQRARNDLEVVWGAAHGSFNPDAGECVVAYCKTKFGDKFVVMFQNISFKSLTEEELKAAKRAQVMFPREIVAPAAKKDDDSNASTPKK